MAWRGFVLGDLGGRSARKVRSKSLIVCRSAGAGVGGPSSATPRATIYTPSARLRASFSLGFEPDSAQAAPTVSGSTWTLTAQRNNPETGKRAALQALVTAQALPNGYEMDSASRIVEMTTALVDTGVTAVAGNFVLVVEWEPNQPIPDEELEGMFEQCDAVLHGSIVTLAAS